MRDVHVVRLPDAAPIQKDVAVDIESVKAQVASSLSSSSSNSRS